MATNLADVAVDLEHGQVGRPVDLVRRRVKPGALLRVTLQDSRRLHVLEAELADVKLLQPERIKGQGFDLRALN